MFGYSTVPTGTQRTHANWRGCQLHDGVPNWPLLRLFSHNKWFFGTANPSTSGVAKRCSWRWHEASGKRQIYSILLCSGVRIFYTLPGGGSASLHIAQWYVSSLHADWIRYVDLSVPGPADDINGVSNGIGNVMLCVWVSQGEFILPLDVHTR